MTLHIVLQAFLYIIEHEPIRLVCPSDTLEGIVSQMVGNLTHDC